MNKMTNAAIGIIGGADGPTSIFIAGRIGTWPLLAGAAAVMILVTIIYLVKKRRK